MEVCLWFSPISTGGFSRLLCYFQQLPLHSVFVFINFNILLDRHDAEWGKQGGKIVLPKFHGGMIARPFRSGKAVDTFGRALFAKVYSPAFIPWFCTFWVEHALVFHFIYHFAHSRLLDVVVCDPAADGAPHRCSFGLIPVEWVKKCFTFFVSEVYSYGYSPKDYGF